MFQSFTASARPEDGPPRVAALRARLADDGLSGVLVPRADRFQGEYVAPCDARLAWLTGFTGSAGFAAILTDRAGVFIDGRYRVQVKHQTDPDTFTPVPWPEEKLEDWLIEALPQGGTVGFDPWLHTVAEITRLEAALAPRQIALRPIENPVDRIWTDRPGPPMAPARQWPDALAGRSAAEKLDLVAGDLAQAGDDAALITQPDSLCWLLNLRGADVTHTPLLHAMAVVHRNGALDLFTEAGKLAGIPLPEGVTLHAPDTLADRLAALTGTLRIDPSSAPHAAKTAAAGGTTTLTEGTDPCLLPKARKHPAEITATRHAHLRDGAAVVRFLHWFDETAPKGQLTEIDCVKQLESFRTDTGHLREISFDTIAGAGPNGAIMHYRVTDETNAPVTPGQLFLIDSGGQYEDGTTDITRTLPVGAIAPAAIEAYTQVLRGLIAIHLARFPKGVAGAHLDALARAPLWAAGRDFDHGTGHGVGVYLGVHEGPQRLSRASTIPLEPGMILSNEPGYYREGAFGIRLENLIVVREAAPVDGGDAARRMYDFETLTFAPFDRRLIDADQLAPAERAWLDAYHAQTLAQIGPQLDAAPRAWLQRACAAL